MAPRIKELREKAGLTQQEVADAIGLHLTNYNRLENGGTDLRLSRMQQLAELFGCRVEELLAPYPNIRMVPITFNVAAGVWSEGSPVDDAGAFREVAVPDRAAWRGIRLYGAEVRGESMNRRYPHGSVIVIADQVDIGGLDALINERTYVVERERDGAVERTVKVFYRRPDGTRWLLPDSTDPTFEPIQLARPKDHTEIRILGRVVWHAAQEPDAEDD